MIAHRHTPLAALALLAALPAGGRAGDLRVTPAAVALRGNFARAQLLVAACAPGGAADERSADLTHDARYRSSDEGVVTVGPAGQLLARGDGTAAVTVAAAGAARTVAVTVAGVTPAPKVGFTEQVMPVLYKAGCNAGACHASQYGKGGFKLSVFGFDPAADHQAITRDGFGRRVNPAAPRASLFLLKPSGGVPHGGGRRLEAGSADYGVLERWVASGAPGPADKAPEVAGLAVFPATRVGAPGFTQQLRVVARYDDGAERDVTAWARFDGMDEGVLSVTPGGRVRAVGRGLGVAMARFGGQAGIASVVVPYADAVDLSGWAENNFVDRLAAARFREVGVPPSPPCDDATFLRRAYLDVTGTLPTPAQAVAFLDAKDPDKRDRLIDELLGLTGDPARDVHNDAYASWWALKWADLVRSNSAALGEQGMWALHNWLTASFRDNKRFDRFARELITARGSTFSNGPANYFRVANSPEDLTEATAQLFLGVRMQCAKCHHHPYEAISQADYYGFAAFFARVGTKASQEFGVFGNETVVVARPGGEVSHPRTGRVMRPTPLHGRPAAEARDRRAALAAWMTGPEDPWFARNVVNRYVAYLLGRGLVEPVDDLRATNPPSNPALMDALAADFVRSGYDVKHLLRTLLRSRLYQLDSRPTAANAADGRLYSHYRVKRLAAEPLLDAIDAATGVPTKFEKVPPGTRAIELPDARYNNYFLTTFGKPRREAVCECERVSDPNLAQALNTLNGDVIPAKAASPQGRVARLVAAKRPPDEVVTELYLATLSRRPDARELAAARRFLAESADPKACYEDLLWSLLNSKHFLFVR